MLTMLPRFLRQDVVNQAISTDCIALAQEACHSLLNECEVHQGRALVAYCYRDLEYRKAITKIGELYQ